MVFSLSALNRVYNLMRICPRQGMNLSQTAYGCTIVVVKFIINTKSWTFVVRGLICSIVIANKSLQNCVKQGSVYFLLYSKQGPKIEGVVQHRACILFFFCPKQGQCLKPSAAPLFPTTDQVPPFPPPVHEV